MTTTREAQVAAILKRLSFGAVPIGGFYWLDPKVVAEAQRRKAAAAVAQDAATQPAPAPATAAQETHHELSSV